MIFKGAAVSSRWRFIAADQGTAVIIISWYLKNEISFRQNGNRDGKFSVAIDIFYLPAFNTKITFISSLKFNIAKASTLLKYSARNEVNSMAPPFSNNQTASFVHDSEDRTINEIK